MQGKTIGLKFIFPKLSEKNVLPSHLFIIFSCICLYTYVQILEHTYHSFYLPNAFVRAFDNSSHRDLELERALSLSPSHSLRSYTHFSSFLRDSLDDDDLSLLLSIAASLFLFPSLHVSMISAHKHAEWTLWVMRVRIRYTHTVRTYIHG